jgi:hypothetical protein
MSEAFSKPPVSSRRHVGLAWVSVLLALALPNSALAAPDGRTPEDRYNDGLLLAQQGKLQRAVDIWLEIADRLQSEADRREVQSSLGFAFYGLGKLEPAWYHLDRYIRSGATSDVEAVRTFQAIEKKLASTHFKVEFHCTPENVRVQFQDSSYQTPVRCPLSWWFSPGEYAFSGASEGHKSQTSNFVMPENGGIFVHKMILQQQTGTLLIEGSDPQSDVFLDGVNLGPVPVNRSLPVGLHDVEIRSRDEVVWKTQVRIRSGTETIVNVVLPPPAPTNIAESKKMPTEPAPAQETRENNTLGWSLTGGGLAAALVGGSLILLASAKAGDVQAGNDQQYNQEVLPYEIPGWTLLGLGTGALLTGGAFLLWNGGNTDEARDE